MVKAYTVVWTDKAISALHDIYNFYVDQSKSETIAARITNEIVEKASSVRYANQYQKDEILPHCRRIIVRHFKILYTVEGEQITIIHIFDTRQDPSKVKD